MAAIDMDTYIAREAEMSVPEIFEMEGEEGFRRREQSFLESMLTRERSILSCGGGTVTRDDSRRLVKKLGTVVYLMATAEEAISRISRPETRPLLSGPVPPAQILEQRLALYEDAADVTVDTSGKGIHEVAAEVSEELRKRGVL